MICPQYILEFYTEYSKVYYRHSPTILVLFYGIYILCSILESYFEIVMYSEAICSTAMYTVSRMRWRFSKLKQITSKHLCWYLTAWQNMENTTVLECSMTERNKWRNQVPYRTKFVGQNWQNFGLVTKILSDGKCCSTSICRNVWNSILSDLFGKRTALLKVGQKWGKWPLVIMRKNWNDFLVLAGTGVTDTSLEA